MAYAQGGFCVLRSGHPHAEPADLQPQEQRCEGRLQEINQHQLNMSIND